MRNDFNHKIEKLKEESIIHLELKNAKTEEEIIKIARVDFLLSLGKLQATIIKSI